MKNKFKTLMILGLIITSYFYVNYYNAKVSAQQEAENIRAKNMFVASDKFTGDKISGEKISVDNKEISSQVKRKTSIEYSNHVYRSIVRLDKVYSDVIKDNLLQPTGGTIDYTSVDKDFTIKLNDNIFIDYSFGPKDTLKHTTVYIPHSSMDEVKKIITEAVNKFPGTKIDDTGKGYDRKIKAESDKFIVVGKISQLGGFEIITLSKSAQQ